MSGRHHLFSHSLVNSNLFQVYNGTRPNSANSAFNSSTTNERNEELEEEGDEEEEVDGDEPSEKNTENDTENDAVSLPDMSENGILKYINNAKDREVTASGDTTSSRKGHKRSQSVTDVPLKTELLTNKLQMSKISETPDDQPNSTNGNEAQFNNESIGNNEIAAAAVHVNQIWQYPPPAYQGQSFYDYILSGAFTEGQSPHDKESAHMYLSEILVHAPQGLKVKESESLKGPIEIELPENSPITKTSAEYILLTLLENYEDKHYIKAEDALKDLKEKGLLPRSEDQGDARASNWHPPSMEMEVVFYPKP